jgi:hypothetical protein
MARRRHEQIPAQQRERSGVAELHSFSFTAWARFPAGVNQRIHLEEVGSFAISYFPTFSHAPIATPSCGLATLHTIRPSFRT